MNICILTSSYPLNNNDAASAAGVFVRDFAIELSNENKVFVITQLKEGEIEDATSINVIRFPWSGRNKRLSTLNMKRPSDLTDIFSVVLSGKKALFDLIKSEKIDLIIAMWAAPCGGWAYLAKRKYGIPYITWTLGSDIWVYGRKKLTSWIIRKILKNSLKVYSDGKELMEETKKIGNCECEFLCSTRTLPKRNLPQIDIDDNKVNYLYIGRYHPHKGVDLLVDAINLIPKNEIKDMHFYIFGGGELEETIKQKVNQYELSNYVSIGSYITADYAAAYLKQVQALIIPSRIESIPLILSDALQMGCPIIATDVGDMGELVNGYNVGKVVEACNIGDMMDAIICMKHKSRSDFQDEIKDLYRSFDLKEITKKILYDIK